MSRIKFFIGYGVITILLFGAFFQYLKSIESKKTPPVINDRLQFDSVFTTAMYASLEKIADTMPEPKPGEWLYEMEEKGQTFEEFVKGLWPRPDSTNQTIYLQPLGTFSGGTTPDLKLLQKFTEIYFMMPVIILPSIDSDTMQITSRTNPHTHHKQLLTTDILDYLELRFPDDAFCLTALTVQDLYPEPSWNFVFGQASLIRRVGVFSFARYNPTCNGQQNSLSSSETDKLILRRSCKVLAHEIGHIFGFYHCIYYRCGMNGSNNLRESDAKPIHLCPVCLRKLYYSIGFDIKERYELLRSFYNSIGFEDYAGDIDRSLEVIQDSTFH